MQAYKEQKVGREYTTEIERIENQYDQLRHAGTLTAEQDAELGFALIAARDAYDVELARIEAVRLADAIAPQFAGQLRAGLPAPRDGDAPDDLMEMRRWAAGG